MAGLQSLILPPVLLILFILSFIGWGGALIRLLIAKDKQAHPLAFCLSVMLGAALFSWVHEWIIYFHLFTPALGFVILLGGAIPGAFFTRTYLRESAWKGPRTGTQWAIVIAAAVLLLLCLYVPPNFNLSDDSSGYTCFPIKIRDTGGIGPDPFSSRRFLLLGGHYPIQAIILSVLPLQHLSILEPALGVALTILVVALLSCVTGSTAFRVCCGILLLAFAWLSGVRMLGNTAPGFMMIPPILVVISVVIGTRTAFSSIAVYGALLGAITGYSVSLRISALPLLCGATAVGVFYEARRQSAWKSTFVKGAISAAAATIFFLLPFCLDMQQSSDKLLPIQGSTNRGVPYRPPPATTYLRNLAVLPVSDVLVVIASAGLFLWIRSIKDDRSRRHRAILVSSALAINYALVIKGSRGVATDRYVAPIMVSILIYLISEIDLPDLGQRFADFRSSLPRFDRRRAYAAVVLTAVLIALLVYHYGARAEAAALSKFRDRESTLYPSPAEVQEYRRMQELIPKGATVLCSLQRNYLLDFRRNRILVNDLPRMYGPKPGWPRRSNGAAMAAFLRSQNVQYVAAGRYKPPAEGLANDAWRSVFDARIRFEADLADEPFASSLIYQGDLFRLYKVPD